MQATVLNFSTCYIYVYSYNKVLNNTKCQTSTGIYL